jgi:hypothetical protein
LEYEIKMPAMEIRLPRLRFLLTNSRAGRYEKDRTSAAPALTIIAA